MRVRRFDDSLPVIHASGERISNWQAGRISPMPTHVPEGWELVPLLSVARLESGHTPARNRGEYWSGSIPWISLHDSDRLDGLELSDTTLRVTPLGIANSSARLLPKGTVVFSRTATVGKSTIMGREMATSQDFANYVCGPRLHNRYLMYLFRFMSSEWVRLMAGSTHNTIYMPVFQSLEILLPPVPEQEAIAGALADADAWIESLEKLIAKKRKIKLGVMQQLLSGTRRLPGFSGKWSITVLGQLGAFSKGSGVRKDEARSGTLPCIRYGELYTHHSDVIRQFNSFISPAVAATAQRLQKGDVLFAGSGETKEEIGKCAAFVSDHGAYAGGDIVIFRPHIADPCFLGYYLNSRRIQEQKASFGQGDAVVHISAGSLAQLRLLMPGLEEQEAIGKALDELDLEILSLHVNVEKARRLKIGMMQTLLTGRVRLK